VKQARGNGLPITYVQRDRDRKFTKSFGAKLKSLRVKMKPGAFRAPNTNAFVERFIQSIGQECLDRFVIFGEQHMDHVCQEYLAHYHEERPHQSLENEPLTTLKRRGRPKTKRGKVDDELVPFYEVHCKQRLGGLLKCYSHKAA
jgi:putative transposase